MTNRKKMTSFKINIHGQHFILHPLKAIYWLEKEALLLADMHMGKVTHFRKAGLAVPREKIRENLEILHVLMDEFHPKNIYFLGDLFHSDYNQEVKLLVDFIDRFPVTDFHLITGNHDLPGFVRAIEDRIEVSGQVLIDGFSLQHEPGEDTTAFQICGHIHPAVKLKGPSKQYAKLPCFYLTQNMLVLPSFGSFTGNKAIEPLKGDRVFVVAGEEVVEV
jgi:DNA ligase-associated metallophosphoesterase